jgi:predicted ATPase
MSATVGRQAEQALLVEALAAARAGRTQVVLLHGEPGIGKTTLVEAAAALAEEQGIAVAWGRSWEAGGAPPYWPFTQILRGLRKHGAEVPQEIARLLPELAGHAPALLSADDRFVLFDGVVRHLGASTPALLALEDLHAADPASLQLLEFVAAHLRGAPLLILGTFRDLEARMTPATASLLERVGRNGQLIAVGPLQRADVAALLARGPSGADDETAGWLHETTKGNPLFVREMLHVLVQGGRKGEKPPLPESVRVAIREHLAALPEQLLAPLEIAAVIGREFASSLVAQVAGTPQLEIKERMLSASRLGILVERGPERFAFAHALIEETLVQDLPAIRRAVVHGQIADALDPSSAAEIARHLFEAGPDSATRAIAAARKAADHSMRQFAFEQAAIAPAWKQFVAPGSLSQRDRSLIGAAVAAQIPSIDCFKFYAAAAKKAGATDEQVNEAVAMAALTRAGSTILNGALVDEAAFRANTDQIVKHVKAGMKEMARR